MSNTLRRHPDRETLLRLLDDDLLGADQQMIDDHLVGCSACRSELEEMRDAAREYLRFHAVVVKTALPPAPKPWDGLADLAARIPVCRKAPRVRIFPSIRAGWLAAAAVLTVFACLRLMHRTPEVNAAALLQKAQSAEARPSRARARSIRIKSRKFAWNRPARLDQGSGVTSADASGIRALLESAGYDWRDPLSATAYAGWHDRLAVKQDRITDVRVGHVIHTTTTASLISDASLTLTPDLRAVACTLRFGEAEALELSELPDEDAAIPENALQPALPADPPASEMPVRLAGPGEELRVVAALHRIGADLGEPIDIRRDGGSVIVRVTGASPRRQAELKTLLEGLPGVRLQFGAFRQAESPELARGEAVQVDSVNGLLAELQAAMPQSDATADLADQFGESTENILIRAYALRDLARRFPQETTAQLPAGEMAVLREIVLDHAGSVEVQLAAIGRLMRPVLPPDVASTGVPENTWQDVSLAMLPGARELDQSVNMPGPGDQTRKLRVARALAELTHRSNRLRSLIQP